MSNITGGIKFFDKSNCLFADGAIATASSNNTNANNILNYNKYTNWKSIGSDDTTTEEIEIEFTETTFDKLFLVNINFKEFNVKYWNGAIYVDFTNTKTYENVVTGNINETTFDKDTAYYTFDPVTTTKIRIQATKTQIVDDQKIIFNVYITTEIGTFEGYPQIPREDLGSNNSDFKVLSGKSNILKGVESLSVSLRFRAYPSQNDYNILKELFRRQDTFLIWLCGGRFGSQYFKIERENWQLKDIFNMQYKSQLNTRSYKNLYKSGFNGNCRLEESSI